MASDGQIVFEVTADGKHAIADIKDITRAIQTETGKWDDAAKQSANNIDSSFSGVLKKLAAGFSAAKIGKALLDLGKEAVQAASDLQEVQNVVDVTFGSNSNKIEAWAKKAGTQFGLTETQAKKFTSTIGAMMKSSGVAGDEIVEMSTDLAGLAADMASFYNLDFEEAFSKIRSGISGQTMPLKELGIDMSVATLNAFALKQGLSKTFDQMSQGEQTMLRYQYLMSATADAQGDFARTSDGYANGMRALETEMTTLKTNLGNNILPVVQWAVESINGLFDSGEEEGWSRRRTVLDDIVDIDVKTQAAIEEIEATKKVVDELITSLGDVGGKKQELDTATGNVVSAAQGVANLATELSRVKIEGDAKTAFESTLTILKNNVDSLAAISGEDAEGITTFLSDIEQEAANLKPDDVAGWERLLGKLHATIPGLANAEAAAEGVKKLAAELNTVKIEGDAKTTFEQTMAVLYNNIDALKTVTGEDAKGVKDWLDGVATEAAKLSPDDAGAWATLLGALAQELPDIDGEGGGSLLERLTQYYLSLGSESEEASQGLLALGYSTEDIEAKQKDWLATCKELVRTMPGLSDIIDTNTGEVKGGVEAIKKYADEWERTAKYQAQVEAIKEKKKLYEGLPEQSDLASDVRTKKATARAYLMGYAGMTAEQADATLAGAAEMATVAYNGGGVDGQAFDSFGYVTYDRLRANPEAAYGFFYGGTAFSGGYGSGSLNTSNDKNAKLVNDALSDYMEAEYALEEFVDIQPQMQSAYAGALQETADAFGMTTDEVEKAADAMANAETQMTKVEKAAKGDEEALADIEKAVESANEALKEMADYVEGVHKNVVSAIDSTLSGFEYIGDASQRQAKRLEPLEKEMETLQESGKDLGDIEMRISNAKDTYGIGTLKKNLDSQLKFLQEYKQDMEKAKALGFSDEFLAQFADGSVESAEWLHELANATSTQVDELNTVYGDIEQSKGELADTLTGQKLSVDEQYENLVAKAKEAVAALDMEQEAADNTGKTIQGIAQGIGDNIDSVSEQVDAIIAELNRLDGYGINIDFGGFGSINFTTSTGKDAADGSGRFGIDYVPRDDYLIRAHEGERLLTAQENQIWNALLNGGVAGFDLDSLGGVMRDNIKPGGNVYLDGKAVGTVISDRQGRNYKSLQRSGWQT